MEPNMGSKKIDLNTGKRISIELGTQLQIEIDGVAGNFKSNLIGMETEQYLIITAPVFTPYGSIKHKLFRGNKVIVRYLHRGTVYGFQSELIDDIYAPLKLLFVKYPRIISEHNIRSAQRINCFLPTKAKIKCEKRDIESIILDLSKSGCCCALKKTARDKPLPSVKIDEQVMLKCLFSPEEGEHIILGKVISIRSDNGHTTLGIMFQEMQPETEEIIVQYVNAVLELAK
jgi:c-di-GMP-binding flagellar brake protein YcgR